MSQSAFIETQLQFARYLRDSDSTTAPKDIEERRLRIYRGLIYNNIENFIASGFPVLRAITDNDRWHTLIRDFIRDYRCHSPYFLEIGREFITYLQDVREMAGWEPPFLLELCHYEWVELALDVAESEIPPDNGSGEEPLETEWGVSPLVWCLSYRFPVHKISENFIPDAPGPEGTHILVYRNRRDEVRFYEINQVVNMLLRSLESTGGKGREVLLGLAKTLQFPDVNAFVMQGRDILCQLHRMDILHVK